MNYKEIGQKILEAVGGRGNVQNLTHCATRLRFTLADVSKADDEAVKAIDGVVSLAKSGGQYQVVVGSDVPNIYRALEGLLDLDEVSKESSEKQDRTPLQSFLALISGIFTPILPVITAAGMIKAVLSFLVVFKVVAVDDVNYQVLNFIGDAGFYFLPVFLGASAARQFKTNAQLGMLIGAILLHPTFTQIVTTAKESGRGVSFFSIPLTLTSYSSTVIPVILAVWFMSYVERFAIKISPKAVKFFLVPMITTLITAIVTLLILGPIGAVIGNWLGDFFKWLENFGPWVVPTIVGATFPLMVTTGTHYGLVSIGINNRMTIGYDTIAQPGALASNVAQGGAALAIALKTKDTNKKALASSAGITAICGITEPALYGVTLQNKAALIGSIVAGGVGGFFLGILGARNFAGGSPGLLTIAAYIGEDTLKYFYTAIAGLVISVVVSFIVTFILYKED